MSTYQRIQYVLSTTTLNEEVVHAVRKMLSVYCSQTYKTHNIQCGKLQLEIKKEKSDCKC